MIYAYFCGAVKRVRDKLKILSWKIKERLKRLSFRTGVIILASCVPLYIISFAQMAFPVSVALKGVLWTIFFGLAKAAQYTGLTIIGGKGIKKLKDYFTARKIPEGDRKE